MCIEIVSNELFLDQLFARHWAVYDITVRIHHIKGDIRLRYAAGIFRYHEPTIVITQNVLPGSAGFVKLRAVKFIPLLVNDDFITEI